MKDHSRKLAQKVDRDLKNNSKPLSFYLPIFGIMLLWFFSAGWSAPARLAVLLPAGTAALLWLAFVSWRSWRLMKAAMLVSDLDYDRKGKFRLPPEYADTESATAARRRRWKQQWRERRNRA